MDGSPSNPPNAASLSGAWAKPLRARVKHFFPDGHRRALCRAYATDQVKPSQFGTDPYVRCCPTCVRKLAYYEEAYYEEAS